MSRTIYLTANLDPNWTKAIAHRAELQPICANRPAARSLSTSYQSLDHLARNLCHQNRWAIAPPLVARRTLRQAIRDTLDTEDIDGMARAGSASVKAMLRVGTGGELQQFQGGRAVRELPLLEAIARNGGDRASKLARLTRRYQQLLHQQQYLDESEILWQATQHATRDNAPPYLFWGYFHPRRDELAFLEAIAPDGSILVLPAIDGDIFADHRESVNWLQQRGWQVETKANELQEDKTLRIDCYAYANRDAEVRGVFGRVKSLLNQGIAPGEIAVVARNDAAYGQTAIDIAWEYDLPLRALYAIPLSTTRVGAWVQLLLETVSGRFPFEATAKFLRHPLTSPSLSNEIWAQVRQVHPHRMKQWQDFDIDLTPLKWSKRDTRAEWIDRLQQVLEFYQVRQNCGSWAREIVAYYRLQESLVALAKPESERLSLEEFADEILESLKLLAVPAQPGRGGVELHTPLSVFGGSYRYVFVLGMAEGSFPAPLKDDAMLDFFDRKQLRRQGFPLETATQMARREAIAFYALQQTAREALTFSYPQILGKDASLPSPFLAQLNLEPTIARSEIAASWEEARQAYLVRERNGWSSGDRILPRTLAAWNVERRRESSAPYDEYDGAISIPLDPSQPVFSASQLTALGQCGFKWFAGYLLKLDELEEAETEFAGSLRGRVYHKTLELALKQALGAENIRQAMLDRLEDAFTEAERHENLPDLSAWHVRRREHLDTLRRAISAAKFLTDGAEVIAAEQTFRGTWYGLQVKGKVDRVDLTPEGLMLVEYKTMSSRPTAAKDAAGKTNLDIQLPLYVQAAAPALDGDRPVAGAYYYSLTAANRLKKVDTVKIDDGELAHFAERIKAQLQQGRYTVEPDRDRHACRYCSFDAVCRQGKRLERKGSDSQIEADR